MANPPVHRAQVLLGGEVESACHALELSVGRALDTAPQAKRSNDEILHTRVSHELADPRILHQPEYAFLEAAHRPAVISRSPTAAWLRAARFQ